jgi:hypothetical protein
MVGGTIIYFKVQTNQQNKKQFKNVPRNLHRYYDLYPEPPIAEEAHG